MIEKNDEDMEINRSNDIEEPQQNHINRSVSIYTIYFKYVLHSWV